jgi:8-oxo-dGTP pyrophosphatase MutT (NUDIX family)
MTNDSTELFDTKPLHLHSPLVVAGAFLLHDNKFLLLRRHPEKPYGLHWNLPAGKIEKEEDPKRGAQRELFEETGINIPLEKLNPIKVFYLKRGPLFIEFHVFESKLDSPPEVKLKLDENTEALWMSLEESKHLTLLGGGKEILDFCLKHQGLS